VEMKFLVQYGSNIEFSFDASDLILVPVSLFWIILPTKRREINDDLKEFVHPLLKFDLPAFTSDKLLNVKKEDIIEN
jgi:hypothetical protein